MRRADTWGHWPLSLKCAAAAPYKLFRLDTQLSLLARFFSESKAPTEMDAMTPIITMTQTSSISVNPDRREGLDRLVSNRFEECLNERCRARSNTALVACSGRRV